MTFNELFYVLGNIRDRLLDTGKMPYDKQELNLKLLYNWCSQPTIAYGKVQLPCGLGLGQKATYICNKGYKLYPLRSKEVKCMAVGSLSHGFWSRSAPRCYAGIITEVINKPLR